MAKYYVLMDMNKLGFRLIQFTEQELAIQTAEIDIAKNKKSVFVTESDLNQFYKQISEKSKSEKKTSDEITSTNISSVGV